MRIALVSTCAVPTPPRAYGGTELVVSELAHGLTELGEDVVVYATGDSRPHGRLRALEPAAVWPPCPRAADRHHRFAMEELAASNVDVVHVNDYAALPYIDQLPMPCVLTIHHERDPATVPGYAKADAALVAISSRQAELHPELLFGGVIHHGIDPAHYPFGEGGSHAAFLGRFAPEKGTHHAIDAAVRAGVPLHLGGAPHEVARRYWEDEVQPRLSRFAAGARHLGELAHPGKLALLRSACSLLMPIEWEEPFGLVMIEAMMVGTPVLAFPRGSAPEVVEDGLTGYLVADVDEMAQRLRALGGFDRRACRARALERFSYLRMTRDHLALYRRLARRVGHVEERHAEHA